MGLIGDLVVNLSANIADLHAGLAKAKTDTKQFATEVDRILADPSFYRERGSKAGRSFSDGVSHGIATQSGKFGGNFTQQLNQLSFGVQDFAAVLGQGGKNSLGRAIMSASNNISMITAGMGPWGAAIGGAAGVLMSTLVPALFATADATDKVVSGIDRAKQALDRVDQITAPRKADRHFAADLAQMGTSDQAEAAMLANRRIMEDAQERMAEIRHEALAVDPVKGGDILNDRPSDFQIWKERLAAAEKVTGKGVFAKDEKRLDFFGGLAKEYQAAEAAGKQAEKQMADLKKKRAELLDMEKGDALAAGNWKRMEDEIAAEKKAAEERMQLMEEAARVRERIENLEQRKQQVQRSNPIRQSDNGALAKGSMAEAVARIDAMNPKREQLAEQGVDLQKKGNEELRKANDKLRDIEKKLKQQPIPVNVPV